MARGFGNKLPSKPKAHTVIDRKKPQIKIQGVISIEIGLHLVLKLTKFAGFSVGFIYFD